MTVKVMVMRHIAIAEGGCNGDTDGEEGSNDSVRACRRKERGRLQKGAVIKMETEELVVV